MIGFTNNNNDNYRLNKCNSQRIKSLFLKILRRLIFKNEVLSHSRQNISFRKFKVLTFKIVCIFRNKYFSG